MSRFLINCVQHVYPYRARTSSVSEHDSSTCISVCTSPHGQRHSTTGRRPRPHLFHLPVSTASLCPLSLNWLYATLYICFTLLFLMYNSSTSKSGFSNRYVTHWDDREVDIASFTESIPALTSSTLFLIRPSEYLLVMVLVARTSFTECVQGSSTIRWRSSLKR